MNNQRRKDIARAIALLQEAQGIIQDAASEERDYYDNMPESLQGGDKGQQAETAASTLEEADSTIDDLISNLEDASQ